MDVKNNIKKISGTAVICILAGLIAAGSVFLASCAPEEGPQINGVSEEQGQDGDLPEVTHELPPEGDAPQPLPEPPEEPPIEDYSLMPEGVYEFPSLNIYSELHPFEAARELWHDGTMSVTGTTQPFQIEDLPVRLRGRGNSSWSRGPEKRPLRLRFDYPRAMLDSTHAARDWVLISNLFDLSLIRTHSAFYLAGLLDGMYWTPFSRLVHVYINDEYQGVYQVADERDVGPGRAQLTYDSDPAVSEYFFERDGNVSSWLRRGSVEDEDFFSVGELVYDIRFPRRRDWDGHLEYARDFVRNVDSVIRTRDFDEISAVIDIPSAIDYYLVQELFKNIDIGNRSMFFEIRGGGGDRRLYFGPVWDFDRSSGNMYYWQEPSRIFAGRRDEWFENFLATPEMYQLIASRWNEIKDGPVVMMIEHIEYLLCHYEEEFDRNFEKHAHIFGGEPRWIDVVPYVLRDIHSARGQIEYFLTWLDARIIWLDNYFN